MKKCTIDSSVIISSLLKNEPHYRKALGIWEDVLKGKCFVINPFSVLVEVVAAIRRRTGLSALAVEVMRELIDTENVSFVILDDKSAIEAAEIAAKTSLRGMDALVVQVAREYKTELISFDKEMLNKAKAISKKGKDGFIVAKG